VVILVMTENAQNLGESQAGWVLWDGGELHGDATIVEMVKSWETVQPTPADDIELVDWSDPRHARTILASQLWHTYGGGVRVFEGDDRVYDGNGWQVPLFGSAN